ncbi:PspC domain-containing protein [Asanoa iriomotensis]|uniref:PspC family transcriptional regulator n=1 Tax=Asanoa iriomotensis TaxID=234613 RepID=A0ABQ4BV66_9ACTN|nr:PspC domain-containing protein [Asanoa iriomotensis]GIF54404.1 PspC family transcriptional regulator [Asanoa iriomotensis]
MTETPETPAGAGPADEAAAPPPGPPPPPPPGAGAAPGTAAFATRYGLTRPHSGRYLAGVCAAIGRATNTDPILWRVLFAVLTVFFAVGVLIYVTAWLLIPAEGDTASPIEAVLGKGRSSMSPVTAIVLGVGCTVLFGFLVTDAFRAFVLGAAILIGGALLLNRNQRGPQPVPSGPADQRFSWSNVSPWAGTAPWQAEPAAPPPAPAPAPAAAPPPVAVDEPTEQVYAAPAPTAQFPPVTGPYPPRQQQGYQPPFAPYGPYGGPPTPPPAPPRPAKPPKPPKERSALGAATFSLIFVAMGVVAMLDLLNVIRVRPTTYFAAALLTIALGLLVGTWLGRARWLIALGLAAAAALGISSIAEYQVDHDKLGPREAVWEPTTMNELRPNYRLPFGDARLDLTSLDFAGQSKEVAVTLNAGDLEVRVPDNVDVVADVTVDAGDAQVFDQSMSGLGQSTTVEDNGSDGAGGGLLRLTIHVNTGRVEVNR